MPKITDEKMEQIVRVLKKADSAINILERANSNRMLFSQTKTELQVLTEELESRYVSKNLDKNENS